MTVNRPGIHRPGDTDQNPAYTMPIPRAIARLNRYLANPVIQPIARRAPGFALVRHHGRRSGRPYSTPVNIVKVEDGLVIALTYGSDVDWLKNLTSAGRATVAYRGREIEVVRPTLLTETEGMAAMPAPVRVLLRLLNVSEFLHLDLAEEP